MGRKYWRRRVQVPSGCLQMGDNGKKNPAVIKVHHSSGLKLLETTKELTDCSTHAKFPRNVALHPDYIGHLPSVVPPGHVRVKLTMRPIQHVDLKIIRHGGYQELRGRDFITIGAEGVGIIHATSEILFERQRAPPIWNLVEGLYMSNLPSVMLCKQIGKDVSCELHRDQRVVPVLFWDNLIKQGTGSWQHYVDVAEENVLILPDVSEESDDYTPDEVASQFVVTPWTALGLFHTAVAGLSEGGFLLLSAPSSTIGRHILGIAKSKKINVVAVVRKDDQKDLFAEMGVEHVISINSTKEAFVEQVKALTGEGGAHAAIDGVGGETTMKLGASLRDKGQVLIYDNAAGTDCDDHIKISLSDLKRSIEVKWWTLTDYLQIRNGTKVEIQETMQRLFNETLDLYRQKYLILPTHERKFTLVELGEALELFEQIKSDFQRRKVLLVNNDESRR